MTSIGTNETLRTHPHVLCRVAGLHDEAIQACREHAAQAQQRFHAVGTSQLRHERERREGNGIQRLGATSEAAAPCGDGRWRPCQPTGSTGSHPSRGHGAAIGIGQVNAVGEVLEQQGCCRKEADQHVEGAATVHDPDHTHSGTETQRCRHHIQQNSQPTPACLGTYKRAERTRRYRGNGSTELG